MEREKVKSIIEAILFAAGRSVSIKELVTVLEIGTDELEEIMQEMIEDYSNSNRGIELIKVDKSYQLCTKKEYYEYIYSIVDKRNKPNLSQAALEVLSIIAYNPKVTRAEIEAIRGVNADGMVYKLLEYNLIEEAGRLDAPGRPTMYRTTEQFLKMFGYTSLKDLPDLPKYKVNENQQIVIDDIINSNLVDNEENNNDEENENNDNDNNEETQDNINND